MECDEWWEANYGIIGTLKNHCSNIDCREYRNNNFNNNNKNNIVNKNSNNNNNKIQGPPAKNPFSFVCMESKTTPSHLAFKVNGSIWANRFEWWFRWRQSAWQLKSIGLQFFIVSSCLWWIGLWNVDAMNCQTETNTQHTTHKWHKLKWHSSKNTHRYYFDIFNTVCCLVYVYCVCMRFPLQTSVID